MTDAVQPHRQRSPFGLTPEALAQAVARNRAPDVILKRAQSTSLTALAKRGRVVSLAPIAERIDARQAELRALTRDNARNMPT